jgi:dCTP deaminase
VICSNREIRKLIKSGLKIEPALKERHLRSIGIRCHLADQILVPKKNQRIDIRVSSSVDCSRVQMKKAGFVLRPGDFVLGATIERIWTDRRLVCRIEGRSTIARLGLVIHCTSGTLDSLFDDARAAVLEIVNVGRSSVVLYPKMPIAMIIVEHVRGAIEGPVQDQYAGQIGPVAPNLRFKTPQF